MRIEDTIKEMNKDYCFHFFNAMFLNLYTKVSSIPHTSAINITRELISDSGRLFSVKCNYVSVINILLKLNFLKFKVGHARFYVNNNH